MGPGTFSVVLRWSLVWGPTRTGLLCETSSSDLGLILSTKIWKFWTHIFFRKSEKFSDKLFWCSWLDRFQNILIGTQFGNLWKFSAIWEFCQNSENFFVNRIEPWSLKDWCMKLFISSWWWHKVQWCPAICSVSPFCLLGGWGGGGVNCASAKEHLRKISSS